ncbi:Calcium-binding mitochondrial carrier protein [Wickerhamomyces ciferrii]|uniref:Calcium-binding mitochondrial carrier protein n=1 Tax=Wickerhamomyces ciferrii (strain ATCC 14091 / BCRC 22168 / CBS 111 / JCM 3599 / NBRC 0793 / NRRL Y-1031 F-60-10) TaxID=1206466 RepID=K0KS49_WICCF|nr:Calcium-binding mitochondrial carrier protein [Wickerhamomyces ciferrii]CCH44159.1 Calcium-binding mitochondrial carrier protein [Wickerhamomyces ciferrii]
MVVEPNLLTAIIAGTAASVAQTTATYPFEYLKVVTQLHRNLPGAKQAELFHQFKFYFSGCGALNIGNALKSGSRFMIFNSASKFMSTENGKTSAPRLVVAGAMTGFIESLWIIPFENLKTTMIENSLHYSKIQVKEYEANEKLKKNGKVNNNNEKQNSKSIKSDSKPSQQQKPTIKSPIKQTSIPKKTFHNPATTASATLHPYILAKQKWDKLPSSNILSAMSEIYQTRGIRGFLQGSIPTLIRQCTNSGVRFGTYTSLRQIFQPHGGELNSYLAFSIGVVSSVAVVAVTQPIDVIKTRMQSRETYYTYTNALNCAYRIFVEEGVKTFWSGWTFRLLKVGTSGGVSFTVYQYVENVITRALKEQPFQPE